ncbi:MAG TPA: hypothetical protein VFK57_21855 [Vicinamibacterales bacterium]|nr:hypothetical protein [Vicinamibacterales bacterium]
MELDERLKHGIERLILLPVRVRHRARARRKHAARVAALATVRRTLEGASTLKSESVKTVFNVGMFVLLLDQDLAYFTDDLITAIGDRKRAFIAKHEAVLLYEAAEDLPQLLGREFRGAVTGVGASDSQVARLNAVTSDLNKFWREHREFLGKVRNTLGAHRAHDALEYSQGLDELKPLEVMALAVKLSGLLEGLIAVLTDIASLTASPAAIRRDMMASRAAVSPLAVDDRTRRNL